MMMNDSISPPPNELSPEDERLLDLLVDGELDEQRRRKLLLTFEEKPSGWRRCALAFLEAQSWGSSFKSLLKERPPNVALAKEAVSQEAVANTLGTPEAVLTEAARSEVAPLSVVALSGETHTSGRGKSARSLSGLAMAASMVVAFTLGLALRHAYAPSDGSPQGVISSPGGIGSHVSAPPFKFAPPMSNLPDAAGEKVRLVVDGDGDPRMVDVPLVDDPTLVDNFPFRNESAIPAEILHELQKMGHRIEHQRRLAPVTLQDGRRLYLPVEDVKIVPVRRQMY